MTVTAHDIPIRGGAMGSATATVVLDEDQLRALMATVDGFPADSLGLAEPDVTMSTELSRLRRRHPRRRLAHARPRSTAISCSRPRRCSSPAPRSPPTASADRFGRLADAVLRDWTVCVAQYIPAGLTLTAVAIDGDELVADFDIDGAIISDPDLQANGTCESAS